MNIREEYSKRREIIKKRLEDFKNVKKEDYFYEACFCILTPQSSAKRCWNAILLLKEKDFLNQDISPLIYLNDKIRFHINRICLRTNPIYLSNLR